MSLKAINADQTVSVQYDFLKLGESSGVLGLVQTRMSTCNNTFF